jgi:hypothetical protein
MPHDEREHDVPIADSVKAYKCDHCEHLHLVLVDEADAPIASAVLTVEMLEGMLNIVKSHAAGVIKGGLQ